MMKTYKNNSVSIQTENELTKEQVKSLQEALAETFTDNQTDLEQDSDKDEPAFNRKYAWTTRYY